MSLAVGKRLSPPPGPAHGSGTAVGETPSGGDCKASSPLPERWANGAVRCRGSS